jgi:hypothetical protein
MIPLKTSIDIRAHCRRRINPTPEAMPHATNATSRTPSKINAPRRNGVGVDLGGASLKAATAKRPTRRAIALPKKTRTAESVTPVDRFMKRLPSSFAAEYISRLANASIFPDDTRE